MRETPFMYPAMKGSIDVDRREMMLAMPVLKAVPGPPSLQDVFHSRAGASAASDYITYVT